MQLRVRNGKGAKGRVLPLSKRLLKELVDYWRAQREAKAGHVSPWLFLGQRAGEPIGISSAQMIYNRAVKKAACGARAAFMYGKQWRSPKRESSFFPCERSPRYSEVSSWPGYAKCSLRESCTCPIRDSRCLRPVLAGCRSSTESAGSFMPNVPLADHSRF
jgi:hypothetical protein